MKTLVNFKGIVLFHMVKCGGTTLNYIFRNNFSSNFRQVWPLEGKTDNFGRAICSDSDLLKFISQDTKAITGHGIRPAFNLFSDQVTKVIFLRDPISRFFSHHNHWINRPKNKSVQFDKEITRRLGDFQEHNYMVNFIAGESNLDMAKEILREFDFVGILEDFDTSLHIMKKEIIPNFNTGYRIENKGNKSSYLNSQTASKYIKDKVRECNDLDLKLYEFAKSEFSQSFESFTHTLKPSPAVKTDNKESFSWNTFSLLRFRLRKVFDQYAKRPNFRRCNCSRVIESKEKSQCNYCDVNSINAT
ncbi:sulfotransferase family 2 domain-containing protein [Euryarchaeota archaeon]|nr:sulfotransferase family 2 domain-containing protein [Euryarchaeota archaeon]